MRFKRNITVLSVMVFIGAGTIGVQQCKPKEPATTPEPRENAFVGNEACKNCHANEYKTWSGSGHYKAMMPAVDSTVLGDFNGKTLVADGVTSRFFKKDGKFFINTQGDDGRNHDYEVKYTFGYYPLQQYLVEFPGGRMQATRASWDLKSRKWFHQYAGQKIPPHDWLHWTGNAQNWNTMCARCHSTNLQKNYNNETDSYHTTYSEINVSCETCHGPGKQHVDYAGSDEYKKGNKVPGAYLIAGKTAGQMEQINTCTPCHARVTEISPHHIPGKEFMDNYIPEIPTTEHYYADGQANDEDFIYTSYAQSKMFSRGVQCTNCHEPHTAKLLFPGNQLCAQCHAKTYDNPSHTFHAIGSEGAQCKNCHMPGKFYMGNDFRYDHTFRVPRPDLSVQYGTPNACNNCHKNKSSTWAADAVKKWYGPDRKYHFAEDLIPGSRMDENSEAHLIRLLKDTSVPEIVKAASASYLGNIQTGNSLNALLNCLNQSDANLRYRALKSLDGFPPNQWMNDVGPLLSDKVRAVRTAAADLFITIPSNQVPPNFYNAFVRAKTELDDYLLYQSDFAMGEVMLGDYYLKQSNYFTAIKYYQKGLKKDTALNYARLNLSVAYNLSQQNGLALQVLQDAVKSDPKNERAWFNMALLYNEMNNTEGAARALAKAVELKSINPRVYYNYGLLLQQQGKNRQAIDNYNQGLQFAPEDEQLNYALALLLLQTGQSEQAKIPAAVLKKNYPEKPDYQKIFQYLKL
jgi:predicted CXXCH cytochrome family protein